MVYSVILDHNVVSVKDCAVRHPKRCSLLSCLFSFKYLLVPSAPIGFSGLDTWLMEGPLELELVYTHLLIEV